ncbi:MAG: DHH family phosphoesterase [Candidatus Omnitrophota bacterium]
MSHGKKTTLREFCKALREHDHFLLSCHLLPEGDAVGSLLAIDSLLRRLGKKTSIICEDPVPDRLQILASERWQCLSGSKAPLSAFKALVTTDCPNLSRLGQVQELITDETVIFNIDHHISNGLFGRYNCVHPEASATGEVVYEIFRKMRMPIRKEEAACLYVAIMTDTGSFSYSNTSARSHQIAADLIRTGIAIEKINEAVHATYSLNKIQLYSRLLSRFKTSSDKAIAWVEMKEADLKHSGASYEDSEGFVDFLRNLKEVQVVFFLSELPGTGLVRVSFRSKGNHDVNQIATHFHGGGHKKAAGCVIRASLEEAEKMILETLEKKFKFHSR